jgi:hypothetical protein
MPLFNHGSAGAALRQSVGMARALAFLLVLLPALAACGADEPAPGGATGTAAPRRAAGDAITAESSGEAFTLAAGAETSLRLSGE